MFYLVIVNKINSGGLKSGSVCLHSTVTEGQHCIKSLERLLATVSDNHCGTQQWVPTALLLQQNTLTKIVFLRVKKIEVFEKYVQVGISLPSNCADHSNTA